MFQLHKEAKKHRVKSAEGKEESDDDMEDDSASEDAGKQFGRDAHNKIPKQETEEEVTRSSWTFGESARLLSLRTISQCSFCL